MKKVLAFSTMALMLVAPAMASDFEKFDADADGVLSYEEIQSVYPEFTEDEYAILDYDDDGLVSEEELTLADIKWPVEPEEDSAEEDVSDEATTTDSETVAE